MKSLASSLSLLQRPSSTAKPKPPTKFTEKLDYYISTTPNGLTVDPSTPHGGCLVTQEERGWRLNAEHGGSYKNDTFKEWASSSSPLPSSYFANKLRWLQTLLTTGTRWDDVIDDLAIEDDESVASSSSSDSDSSDSDGEIIIITEDNEDNSDPTMLTLTTSTSSSSKNKFTPSTTSHPPPTSFASICTPRHQTYPFELDLFQKQALMHLHLQNSIFVAAHTSSGKTLPAQYALQMALDRGQKGIFTSPVKALSNQKYRDFLSLFPSLGLLTGDTSINPSAPILICTTEVLRSMLYRGSDVIKDVGCVVFDEIHYLNDEERGVVYEECILALPNVQMVFLSATVEGKIEFSGWVGSLKRRTVAVIETRKRVVPLRVWGYWEGEYEVVEEKEVFKPEGLRALRKKEKEKEKKKDNNNQQRRNAHVGTRPQFLRLIKSLEKKDMLPSIFFCFSKKRCDSTCESLKSHNLTSASEKFKINKFFKEVCSRLNGNDSKLPQVLKMREWCLAGYGSHHAGILPILKETVEMLFTRGLIKVLIATETFATGVNVPSRSVVFTEVRKNDGVSFRNLNVQEFTQMKGRAGRRGFDERGEVVVCMFGDVLGEQSLGNMCTGRQAELTSQFRVNWTMILTVLRVEGGGVEDKVRQSFGEGRRQKGLVENKVEEKRKKLELALNNKRDGIDQIFVDYVNSVKSIKQTFTRATNHFMGSYEKVLNRARLVILELQTGLVHACIVKQVDTTSGKFVALILSNEESTGSEGKLDSVGKVGGVSYALQEFHVRDVVYVTSGICKGVSIDDVYKGDEGVRAAAAAGDGFFGGFGGFGAPKKRDDEDDFFGKAKKKGGGGGEEVSASEERSSKSNHILEVEKIIKALVSDPKPVFDFKEARKGDMEASNATAKLTELTMMLETFDFHMEPSSSGFVQAQETWELENEVQRLKHLTSDEALALYPDFIAKRNVLVDMGYLEEENVATLKGRACVNINTCEESIMLTEIIFQGLLDELNPMEIAAVLTAVIFQERRVTVDLEGEGLGKLKFACERVKEVCRVIGVQLRSSGLPIDPDQYVEDNLKFGLAHVAHAWACGLPFVEICNLTEVLEGSIVRTLNRLDEVLREVQHVCRVTGDAKLHLKCEEASMLIKRDVCFSPSLYLS